jgi:large repetitive protein
MSVNSVNNVFNKGEVQMVRTMCLILTALAMCAFTVNAATVSGIVDTGGVPLAGVIVTITPVAGGAGLSDTTNATGDYSITGLTAGFHTIDATLSGFAPYTGFVNIPNAGSVITGRNITLIVLPPGITISGSVTDSATGNPLTGGIVRLSTIGGGATVVDSATVALAGTYSLLHVQAGTYNLSASAAGHVTQTLRVVVAAANLARNFLLVGLPAGIVISGTVSDSVSGNALAGAKVYLRTGGGGGGALLDSAVTSGTGTYSIDSVAPGNYRLVASAALHTTKTINPLTVAAAPITQNFQLVGLPAGIIISGTVTDSVSGNPLAGAVVRLRTGGFPVTVIDSAITSGTGTYSIDSVMPGTYSLNATAAGHTAKTIAGVVVAAAPISQNIPLVGLPAGIRISGSVIDSVSGLPLAGAIVRLRTPAGPGGGTLVDSAITIANGTYAIDSVQPGTYNLVASDVGHVAKTDAGIVVAAAALVRNFELVRAPGIAISGRVADSASGLPLAGAIVRAFQAGVLVDSAIVATNGSYSLSVPAGTYTMTANAAGHGTKTITGVVVTTTPLTENFMLVSGAVGTVSAATVKMLKPDFSISAAGILQLRNFNEQGVVSVFSVNGKLVYRTGIVAHATAVVLPKTVVGGMYLVSVTQKSAVYNKQVIMP